MSEIPMPRLSDTMEEGTILRWLKHDGEHVARGEELVEIETDKANMTYEADRDGVLHTLAREGDTLAVGQPIAQIGEQMSDGEESEREPAHERGVEAELAHERGVEAEHSDGSAESGEEAKPRLVLAPQPPAETADAGGSETGGRVKVSPLARRIARERGVNLSSLVGSGPGGRIVRADVEASGASASSHADSASTHADAASAHADAAHAPAQPAPGPATSPDGGTSTSAPITAGELAGAKGETRIVELSRTQRTIARRMAESKATIPDFTLRCDVNMQACVELRTELKRLSQPGVAGEATRKGAGGGTLPGDDATDRPSGDGHTVVPTYNDMVIKACAGALRDYPRANGSYRDGRFELHSRVNVGIAVSVNANDPLRSALVVPTVFDADTKALGEIARETRALVARVRDGGITPPELSGGTFTVSNLGMFGIHDFTAIINPPQAAILAVGALEPRPVARKRKVSMRHSMTVTLSCDHRILYGADAALFLARVRELLEEPAALTL